MTCCILRKPLRTQLFQFLGFLFISGTGYAQPCITPGQNPSTALPVCGATSFAQNTIPACKGKNLFVPGCSEMFNNPEYANKNAFWYKFTCSSSGTLGFLIDPHAEEQDYDWQLYDITGRNPDDVYTDTSLVVAGNWAGAFGTTGASADGSPVIICASEDQRFAKMPNLIEGHDYLLVISCFYDNQDGYTLYFNGGTAVINAPGEPHLQAAVPDCDGKVTLKLNKKMRCSTLTVSGSEFSLSSTAATIVSATSNACSAGAFYFDELRLTLSNTLANGNYQLMINYGSDGNTLLDDCDRSIPTGEQVPFRYSTPQPIFADSIGHLGCSPDSIKVYFPKRIDCSTVATNGSDFIVNGPSPVTVIGAAGDCAGGSGQVVTVRFSAPIYTKGDYTLALKAGTDGTTIRDACDYEMPQQTLTFRTEDTVSAGFDYSSQLGCRFNTITFSHNGAHDVNSWNWRINNGTTVTTQTHSIDFLASSTNDIQLIASNGICSDTANTIVTMDNEVKADFEMPVEVCSEDPFIVNNTSTGMIDKWQWSFGTIGSSSLKDPPPQYFPQNNVESNYIITLKVFNNALNCSDSISKPLRVLSSCLIAVPTAFTPNGDGLNDFLYPINALKATDLEFKIFNRWGLLVFSSRNGKEKWDGNVGGKAQPSGVFVWYLKYTHSGTGQRVFQKGTTVLLR
jgi:gliding motility-associated-like protein